MSSDPHAAVSHVAVSNAAVAAARPRRDFLLVAALVAAGLLAYASSFGGAFVLDDLPHIVDAPALAQPTPWPAIRDPRPLVALTLWFNHAADRALGGDGLDPLGYHLVNLLVHLAAGLTLFGIVRRSVAGDRRLADWLAFATALLWLVHPLTTQAVTYIIQRGESMMALFFLLSIYCVIRGERRHARRACWYAAAVAAGWLSCMSKQVAVMLPVVMLLYDRAFLAGSFAQALRRRWMVYGLLGLSSAALLVAPVMALFSGAGDASAGFAMERVTPLEYALSQPGVILHYLRLVVWPTPLVFDYAWPVATSWPWIIGSAALVAALAIAAAVAAAVRPKAGFPAAAFFLVLAPTSSFMPINDLAVEHRMYLPLSAAMVLAVLAGAWLLRRAFADRWWTWGGALLAVLAAVLGAMTFQRNFDYHDAARLWRQTLRAAPLNARAHHNLANALFSRGQVEESIDSYRQAIALEPDDPRARVNFGVALMRLGRVDEAIEQFRLALAVDRRFAPALNQLGMVAVKGGRLDAAATWFERAIDADPHFVDAYVHLGHARYSAGENQRAATAYEQALRLRPTSPANVLVHNNLGVILAMSGKLPQALEHFEQAVRLDPDFADAKANLQRAREMLRQPRP